MLIIYCREYFIISRTLGKEKNILPDGNQNKDRKLTEKVANQKNERGVFVGIKVRLSDYVSCQAWWW